MVAVTTDFIVAVVAEVSVVFASEGTVVDRSNCCFVVVVETIVAINAEVLVDLCCLLLRVEVKHTENRASDLFFLFWLV